MLGGAITTGTDGGGNDSRAPVSKVAREGQRTGWSARSQAGTVFASLISKRALTEIRQTLPFSHNPGCPQERELGSRYRQRGDRGLRAAGDVSIMGLTTRVESSRWSQQRIYLRRRGNARRDPGAAQHGVGGKGARDAPASHCRRGPRSRSSMRSAKQRPSVRPSPKPSRTRTDRPHCAPGGSTLNRSRSANVRLDREGPPE